MYELRVDHREADCLVESIRILPDELEGQTN
jgi:hypothetical protein